MVRDLLQLIMTVLTVGLVGAAVVVPAILFIRESAPETPRQLSPPPVPTPVAHLPQMSPPGGPPAIPVLAYHDISEHGGPYTVTPRRFAEHMATLRAAGYATVGLREVRRLIDEGRAPDVRRPVLITFDDGPASLYTTADPILAQHGFQAVGFLITGSVPARGPSYYLSWDLAAKLVDTGRWTFGGHTHALHDYVPLPDGGTGPALINRLVVDGQIETFEAWRARVQADLDASVDAFVTGLGRLPAGFAYPFTARTHPSNDQRIPGEVGQLVADRFGLAFGGVLLEGGAVTEVTDPVEIPRIPVTADMTAQDVLAALDDARPTAPTAALAALRWDRADGACHVGTYRLRVGGPGYHRCKVLGDTSLWRDYTARIDVRGADRDVTALLAVRDGPAGRVEIVLGESLGRIRQRTAEGWQDLAPLTLEPAAVRRVEVIVSGVRLRVRVDDQLAAVRLSDTLASGAIGFGVASRAERGVGFTVHEVVEHRAPRLDEQAVPPSALPHGVPPVSPAPWGSKEASR